MADNSRNYKISMRFDANIKEAGQKIQELQNQLDKLHGAYSTKGKNGKEVRVVDTKSLNEAKKQIQGFQIAFDKAFNTSTGKLNLDQLSSEMKQAGITVNGLYTQMSKYGTAGKQAFVDIATNISKAEAPAIRLNAKMQDFMKTLMSTAKWQISASIYRDLIGTIERAYIYAQQLNESLNSIQIVTKKTNDEMARFSKEANKAAKALGTTTTAYLAASTLFFQQGLDTSEVKKRTEVVVKMANVTKDAADEVSSYMTAIWNNYAKGSDNLEHFADVITALGATTAASSSEIAEGLERFASIGETVGLSYEYATSALAAVVANTRQSADSVGTSFKTLFARLQSLQLGETLEDGVNLNKYSKALNAVGVQVLDLNGELRSADRILDDVAARWETLNSAQKTALAQTVSGTRQYTQFVALMENWGDVQTNLLTAGTADGTLQEQADIYAKSWEAARKRVKAALEELYDELVDDNFFIGLSKILEGLIKVISNVTQSIGGMQGILLGAGAIFMGLFAKEVPGIIANIGNIFSVLTGKAQENALLLKQSFGEQLTKAITDMDNAIKNGNDVIHQRMQFTKQLNDLTISLAKNERFLTKAEAERYRKTIENVRLSQEEIIARKTKIIEDAQDTRDKVTDKYFNKRAVDKKRLDLYNATQENIWAENNYIDSKNNYKEKEQNENDAIAERDRIRAEIQARLDERRQTEADKQDALKAETDAFNQGKAARLEEARQASKERTEAAMQQASQQAVADYNAANGAQEQTDLAPMQRQKDLITKYINAIAPEGNSFQDVAKVIRSFSNTKTGKAMNSSTKDLLNDYFNRLTTPGIEQTEIDDISNEVKTILRRKRSETQSKITKADKKYNEGREEAAFDAEYEVYDQENKRSPIPSEQGTLQQIENAIINERPDLSGVEKQYDDQIAAIDETLKDLNEQLAESEEAIKQAEQETLEAYDERREALEAYTETEKEKQKAEEAILNDNSYSQEDLNEENFIIPQENPEDFFSRNYAEKYGLSEEEGHAAFGAAVDQYFKVLIDQKTREATAKDIKSNDNFFATNFNGADEESMKDAREAMQGFIEQYELGLQGSFDSSINRENIGTDERKNLKGRTETAKSLDELQAILDEFIEHMKKVNEEAKKQDSNITDEMENEGFISENKLDEMSESAAEAGQEMSNLNAEVVAQQHALGNLKPHVATFSEQLTKASGQVLSLVYALNQIKTIGNIINDDTLSNFEKFTNVLMSVCIAIPMVVNGLSFLKPLFKGLIGEAAVGKIKGFGNVVSGVIQKIGAALAHALGPWLAPIIAGISGIIALVVFLKNEAKNRSAENQLKLARQTASNLTSALTDAKNAAKELNQAFDEYDSVVDKLNSCITGTQEWRDALTEVNSKVLELIDTYPELGQYITVENGVQTISAEGEQYLKDQAAERVEAATAAALSARREVIKWEERVQRGEIVTNLGSTNDLIKNLEKLNLTTQKQIQAQQKNTEILMESMVQRSSYDSSDDAKYIAQGLANSDYYNKQFDKALSELEAAGYGTKGLNKFDSVNGKARQYAAKYIQAAGLEDEGWSVTDTTGTDTNRNFIFVDANGEKHTIALEQMKTTIASAQARESVNKGMEQFAHILSGTTSSAAKNFVATLSLSDHVLSDFEGQNIFKYLEGNGIDLHELREAYGMSMLEMELAYQKAYTSYQQEMTKQASFGGSRTLEGYWRDNQERFSDLSLTATKQIHNMLETAFTGTTDVSAIEDFVDKLTDKEVEAFGKAANSIKWDQITVAGLEEVLNESGIQTNYTEEQLSDLIETMRKGSSVISGLNTAFSKLNEVLNKLTPGANITETEFTTIGEEYKDAFIKMADGTFTYLGNGIDLQNDIIDNQISLFTHNVELLNKAANVSDVDRLDYREKLDALEGAGQLEDGERLALAEKLDSGSMFKILQARKTIDERVDSLEGGNFEVQAAFAQENLASLARTEDELSEWYDKGIISHETYIKGLQLLQLKLTDAWKKNYDEFYKFNEQLNILEKKLSQLSVIKNHAFGGSYIEALDRENAYLAQEISLYEGLSTAQMTSALAVREQLESFGFNFGGIDGNLITNYEEITKKYANNEAVADLVKEYQSYLSSAYENLNKKIELEFNVSDNELEKVNKQLENGINTQSALRSLIDFNKTVTTNFFKTDKTIDGLRASFDALLKTATAYTNSDIGSSTLGDIERIQNAISAASGSDALATLFNGSESAQLKRLAELNEQLRDTGLEVYKLYEQSWENYLDAIKAAGDQWDKIIEDFEDINDQLDHYGKVIELLYGGSESVRAQTEMQTVYQTRLANTANEISAYRKEIASWNAEIQKLEGDTSEQAQNAIAQYQEQIREATDGLNSAVENYIQTALDNLNNANSLVKNKYSTTLFGNEWDTVRQDWDDAKAYADKYYDSVDRVYQLEQLESKYKDAIAGVSAIKNQQKLNELMNNELKLLGNQAVLSKKDMEIAEKKLGVYKAQIALEEAQNNKSTMKLVRNANGNWTYQYVADLQEVSKKQEEYKDALYELKQLTTATMQGLVDEYMTAQEAYFTKLDEINRKTWDNEKERAAAINALKNQYFGPDGILTNIISEMDGYAGQSAEEAIGKLIETLDEKTREGSEFTTTLDTINSMIVEKLVNEKDSGFAQTLNATKSIIDNWKAFATEVNNTEIVGSDSWKTYLNEIKGLSTDSAKISSNIGTLINEMGSLKNYYDTVTELGKKWQSVATPVQAAANKAKELRLELEKVKDLQGVVSPQADTNAYFDTISNTGIMTYKQGGTTYSIDTHGEDAEVINQLMKDDIVTILVNKYMAKGYERKDGGFVEADWPSGEQNSNSSSVLDKITGFYDAIESINIKDLLSKLSLKEEDYKKLSVSERLKYMYETLLDSPMVKTALGDLYEALLDGSLGKTALGMDTGGYTGSWNDGSGRIAMLHSKELVLNAEDTSNMLSAVSMIRDISSLGSSVQTAIASGLANMMSKLNGIGGFKFNGGRSEQGASAGNTFNIQMDVGDRDVKEIQEAILNLPNLASQYLSRA